MNRLKQWLVILLVLVNLGLLGALVNMNLPQAEAVSEYPTTNYVVMTGAIGSEWDALYIIDVVEQKMAAWKFDRTSKRLVAIRGVDLARDFARRAPN